MSADELRDLITIEFLEMDNTLALTDDLRRSLVDREPTVHELAAFGTYLHNLYSGVENTLKRFAAFHCVRLPDTADWHVQLLKMFADAPAAGLPVLLPGPLMDQMSDLRGFRHVFSKRYASRLDWAKLSPLVDQASAVSEAFQRQVLSTLDATTGRA